MKRLRQLLERSCIRITIGESRYSHGDICIVGTARLWDIMIDSLTGGDDEYRHACDVLEKPWFPGVTGAEADVLVRQLAAKLDAMTPAQLAELEDYLYLIHEGYFAKVRGFYVPSQAASFEEFLNEQVPGFIVPVTGDDD